MKRSNKLTWCMKFFFFMLVKLDNPVLLARAVEIISELVTEVRMKVGEFGMSISAMDPAPVLCR